ncbi:MAG: MBL fold metallo-hydrolase [Anaerolineae bacterium]|nr:MBL fold metallo-hydrolase [Anaerolineae bacterium]MDW8099951.1 MBL fold metallo-hydrolase [Anaerolineae bacterium]
MILERLIVGPLQVNCYILGCTASGEAIVIDPGDDVPGILSVLKRHRLRLVKIVNTHAHFDHVLGVRELQRATGAPFLLHPDELPILEAVPRQTMAWLGFDPGPPPALDQPLQAGEWVRFGQEMLEVRWTPGHSPGGISLVDHAGRRVFTGDALFAGSIGRTDLEGADTETLLRSICEQLLSLPEDYEVLPGHGPATTIGEERRNNPFVQPGVIFRWRS